MAKLTDTQKDEGNGSFVNFVITKMICKDPWGQLVRSILNDVRGPKIPKIFPQMFRTRIVHTSGKMFDLLRVVFFDFSIEKYL